LWVLCVVRYRSLRLADQSSRGILPSVVCPMCVIAKPRKARSWPGIGSKCCNKNIYKRLRWSRGSVLPLSTQVRGFKSGRSHQDFSGRKNPQHAFLRRGSKAVSPMLQTCGM
jgi:hypothetical protein